jgi:GntR family transcriptional regulator
VANQQLERGISLIKLDLQSRLPIYEQLRSKIIELVMLGELGPDDQLPSVRAFARDLGVNPNTVQKAYQELERDKIIYSVAGRGSYINPEIDKQGELQQSYLARVRQAAAQAKSCGIGEERVVDAVREVYKEGERV